MEGKELAQFKNDVLRFIQTFGSNSMGIDFIYEKMPNHPFQNPYELMDVLVQMTKEAPEYFDFDEDNTPPTWFSPTEMTVVFLNNGGFVNRYESDREADEEALRLKLEDDGIRKLEAENLALTARLNRQRLKTHLIPILISLVGLGVALASFFRPSNNVLNDQTNSKIESIEKELEELRIEYKEKNKELEDKLYKADMLISIYESDKGNHE